MKKFSVCCFLGALAAIGCGGDETEASGKGEVDVEALEVEGVEVGMDDSIGSITVPFLHAVPMASISKIETEMTGAVSLVVSSVESGASADLADGTMVESEPNGAGEFAWTLDEDRSQLTMTFYNETTSGLTLKRGSEYRATLAISENDYVVEVPAMTFDIAFETPQ